jgi:hypothetical protein
VEEDLLEADHLFGQVHEPQSRAVGLVEGLIRERRCASI